MITYIENNGYGTPIELIAAGKEGLGITEFNQLNLDLPVDKIEAYKRFSGGLRNLIKVGILKIESGEVVKGKNYDAYYNFILKKQHDLTSAGIEIKESE
jgi:hypothetical protein